MQNTGKKTNSTSARQNFSLTVGTPRHIGLANMLALEPQPAAPLFHRLSFIHDVNLENT